jgi:hypothetical protein
METEASLYRKTRSAGQLAYETVHPDGTPWEELPLDEGQRWCTAAVTAWKKITEANTDKRFLT